MADKVSRKTDEPYYILLEGLVRWEEDMPTEFDSQDVGDLTVISAREWPLQETPVQSEAHKAHAPGRAFSCYC